MSGSSVIAPQTWVNFMKLLAQCRRSQFRAKVFALIT
jgi:hypothetical protein